MFDMPPPSTMDVRIHDVDDRRQATGEAILVSPQGGLGAGVPRAGRGGNSRRVSLLAGGRRVVAAQGRPRQERFEAAAASAVTGRTGALVRFRPGQRIVSPLAADRVRADERAPVDDNAAARAGAEDDAEDDLRAPSAAVGRLR